MKKIFIDAGHNNSNFNTGAVGNGLREQDITFSVAYKLAKLLNENEEIDLKLSRSAKETNLGTNNTTAINTRWQMANAWGADYFISIHVNAGGGTGSETLYFRPDSLNYATAIHNAYIAHMGIKNRGLKYRGDVAVIKNTNMPSMLIELGFIDNVNDVPFLKDKHDDMAQGLYEGFVKLLGLKEKQNDVVSKTNVLYNGSVVEVERILYGGYNFVKLRELEKFGLKVGFDNVKCLPIINPI